MREIEPVFDPKATVDEAFPELNDVMIKVAESSEGVFSHLGLTDYGKSIGE